MKRLRRFYEPQKISYYHCGEYGERSRRPHYHALLFGLRFLDVRLYKKSPDGSCIYTSEILSRVWEKGFCTIGSVTFESAAYCARYVLKKMTGTKAVDYYKSVDPETGEITQLQPEYVTMSLKPAIGKDWYEEFSSDVYPDDYVVIRGKKMKPPKYYDRLHDLANPEAHSQLKEERKQYADSQKENSTPDRLAVRQAVTLSRISTLKRDLE